MAENALELLGKKALIVTDKVMIDLGNCAKVEKALTNQGIAYSIYSDICGEPTDTMIEKGLQIYKDENCDFLVALGGGSPIDSMKAIGSLVVNGGSISDYMGKVIRRLSVVYDPATRRLTVESAGEFVEKQIFQRLDELAKGKPLRLTLTVEP